MKEKYNYSQETRKRSDDSFAKIKETCACFNIEENSKSQRTYKACWNADSDSEGLGVEFETLHF